MDQTKVSVVVACYNEASHLASSLRELRDHLSRLRLDYELIIIDDASQDQTWDLIEEFTKDPGCEVRISRHGRNVGRGGTVSEGIRAARYDLVGFIDIDLEIPPCFILPLVQKLEEGADVALAWRIYRIPVPSIFRWILSKGYMRLVKWLLGTGRLIDTETGCKFFRRARILPILESVQDTGWFWDTEIVVRSLLAGLKVAEVPALYHRRPGKKSTVKVLQDSWDYFLKLLRFRKTVKALRQMSLNAAQAAGGESNLRAEALGIGPAFAAAAKARSVRQSDGNAP